MLTLTLRAPAATAKAASAMVRFSMPLPGEPEMRSQGVRGICRM